jgi:2-polyprenyl-3-methyl-5-hydroxy-6-metoxy-1,4-benzoquinol methylase
MRYLEKEAAILEMARGQRVLHLGCVGFTDLTANERIRLAHKTLHYLLTQCAEVVGVDLSAAVVREYERLGIFSNILIGNVERLSDLALNQTFDLIVAGDIIEHVSNPGLMLDGIKRFCRLGTRIVITTPHAFGLPNYLRFLAGRFRDGMEHVATYNMQNLAALLARHGYLVEEMATCYQPRARPHGLFILGKLLLRRVPQLGGTLFVVARLSTEVVSNGSQLSCAKASAADQRDFS